MKYLSLFSGIEACTVAWKPLGWECVAVAEIEPFPCAVLAHHYPNVPNLGDVTKITEEDIKNLGQIDLVVFGSPCQNLSVAGNRKGLQGESSGLFYEAIRLISYARQHNGCRFALWENVPGSFSSNKGDDFREVVRELSANRDINTPENGWGNTGVALGENGLVEWRVLDAQYFGLAQRRKRVFAIVDFGNWMDRPPILLEPKGVCGDTPPSRETGQGFATDTHVSTVREGSFGTFVDSEVGGTSKASGGVLGGGSESLVVVHGTQDPITSETAADRHAVAANSIIRRLTPAECEILQGFPRNYTKIPYRKKDLNQCPDSPRYKALGNSMAVPVMRWIGKQIQKAVAYV